MTGVAPAAGLDVVQAVDLAVAAHRDDEGPLLEVLHSVQAELGWVPQEATRLVADRLNLSRAEVHGVVTFYADFRERPPAAHRLRVCAAEACQARGSRDLVDVAQQRLGVGLGDQTADGSWELDKVFCLGNCALGPSAEVDGVTLRPGRLGPARRGDRPRGVGRCAMTVSVFVPRDTAARSVGADDVAARLGEVADVRVVRNGSRGMLWLEPLVEVETPEGRVGYGPVALDDVDGLLDAGLLEGGDHPLRLGIVDELPWMRGQQRVTFARVGVVDPLSLEDYRAHGGLVGLRRALEMDPADVVSEVKDSGLRGRGGAGFPAGIKWNTVHEAAGPVKHVVLQRRRGRQRHLRRPDAARGRPLLPDRGDARRRARGRRAPRATSTSAPSTPPRPRCCAPRSTSPTPTASSASPCSASSLSFDLHVRMGAGAYICGEETSMLNSLEGKRGEIRAKPPIPALVGLFGRPTLVHNLLTLASIPMIAADGGAAYAEHGVGRSRGTQVFQLAGNIARGGIVEADFGVTLRELVGGLGRRHRQRPPGPRGPGRRPARRLPARRRHRPADGLRSVRRGRRDGRARRRRRLRRHRRHGRAGALRDGVLRRGVVRQVHALPDRLAPRRRGDRQDHRGPRPAAEPRRARRPVRHDDRRVPLRDGRADPDARAQRDPALPRGLRPAGHHPARRVRQPRRRPSCGPPPCTDGGQRDEPARRTRPRHAGTRRRDRGPADRRPDRGGARRAPR